MTWWERGGQSSISAFASPVFIGTHTFRHCQRSLPPRQSLHILKCSSCDSKSEVLRPKVLRPKVLRPGALASLSPSASSLDATNVRLEQSASLKSFRPLAAKLQTPIVTAISITAVALLAHLQPGLWPQQNQRPQTNAQFSCLGKTLPGKQHSRAPILQLVPVRRDIVAMVEPPKVPQNLKKYAPRFSIQERVGYTVSEFLMWNPMARVLALFAAGLAIVYVGSLLFTYGDPTGSQTSNNPMWTSLRNYLSPLGADYSTQYLRALSLGMGLLGMLFFGIFLGTLTDAIERGIESASAGGSRVVATRHYVVLGWNATTTTVISDIIAVSRRNQKVVVLVPHAEKESTMEELRDQLSESEQKRVSVRHGTAVHSRDLDQVAAGHAAKIIICGGRGISVAESDRRVLSRARALRSNLPYFSGDIIAELSSHRDEAILESILAKTSARSVQGVSAERLLFRFLAQAIRNEGLIDCVSQMMGRSKSNIFHVVPVSEAGKHLIGENYRDISPLAIPGSIICGIADDEHLPIYIGTRPDKSHMLTSTSRLLVIGDPIRCSDRARKDRLDLLKNANQVVGERHGKYGTDTKPEKVLICGWRAVTMVDLLKELDLVLAKGSEVTIVDDDAPDETQADELFSKFQNFDVTAIQERADSYKSLESLLGRQQEPFDHILVLSSALGQDSDTSRTYSGVEEDSNALTSLCYINQLLAMRDDKGSTKITIEFVNSKVADIAKDDGTVSNVILPHALRAHIASQTVRDRRLGAVWTELLSQFGKETYLRRADDLLSICGRSRRASFAEVVEGASTARKEIVVGFIKGSGDSEMKPIINPQGAELSTERDWDGSDLFITLAED